MHRTIGPDSLASSQQDGPTPTPTTRTRFDDAAPRPARPSAAFRAFAAKVREELDPEGPIEAILAERAIAAAWRIDLQTNRDEFDDSVAAYAAECSLSRTLTLLHELQDRRDERHPAPPIEAGREPEDPTPSWREHLDLDATVSEISPVVKGTWITVGHVVSLIVDGWTWKDVLRTHPELTEDDIRACLTYAVEEEGGW